MGHYDSAREDEYAKSRERERLSKVECAKSNLAVIRQYKLQLTTISEVHSKAPAPAYVKDALAVIENFYKAQLYDNLRG